MAKTPGRAPVRPRAKKPVAETAQSRPGKYSRAHADKICEELAKGEPLYRICEADGMPAYTTVYAWERKRPDFAERVAQARQAGADYCADRALTVADESTKDTAQRDRLLVATLMKRAALIAPRRWGGKVGKEEADAKARVAPNIVFYVRRFERVVAPDGSVSVRELKPEGQE